MTLSALFSVVASLALAGSADSQPAARSPAVMYRLRVDSADTTAYSVEMRVHSRRDTFTVAMVAHPEYDDRYWRFVRDLTVQAPGGAATITRVDSARWLVRSPVGETTIRYRIVLPAPEPAPRAAWRPFVETRGALVGGPHSFMYMPGLEATPAEVTLDLPLSWRVATGMTATANARVFHAASVDELVESPILAGNLKIWRFEQNGVPHRVAYWPSADAVPFDTTAFVAGIRGLVREAAALFGGVPWRDYTFMFRDAAYGGLEHANSVTLGITSADLSRNPHAHLPETGHEFVHAWNLMRIRPAEYQKVTWRRQPQVSVLWFSEGLTLMYADVLARRAGLPLPTPSRAAHLQGLIERYLANPGNGQLSAERVSRAEYNSEPDALGDYSAGSHLQGELIGTMLDLIVRDATDGKRSMDDVMRLMFERFSPERGFMGPDVERAVEDVCGCDVTPFFNAHIRNGSPIDFDRYLGLIGLRTRVSSQPVLDRDRRPAVDLGIWAWMREADQSLRLRISSPTNIWGRAGLHTGDRIVTLNGTAVGSWPEFRAGLLRLRIGDTAVLEVDRPSGRFRAEVKVGGYNEPVVQIDEVPSATERSRRLRAAWVGSR